MRWRPSLRQRATPTYAYEDKSVKRDERRANTVEDFPRWLNGDLTRFCGHGYHEGTEGVVCQGTIDTIGIKSTCLCPCHHEKEQVNE